MNGLGACAGLQAGQQTQKARPIFARLEQDFVTEPPKKAVAAAAV